MNKHTKQKNFSTIRKRSHVLGLKIPSLLSTTFCNFFIKISVQSSAMYNICFNLELENAGLNVFLVIFLYIILNGIIVQNFTEIIFLKATHTYKFYKNIKAVFFVF